MQQRKLDMHGEADLGDRSSCSWPCLTRGCTCDGCGYALKHDYDEAPSRQCRGGQSAQPSNAKQAWNYAKALAKWTAAGMPKRDQAEIDRLFAICNSCEHFVNDSRPHCGLCGCSCGEGDNPLANKLAMGTEHCPLDPPKW